MSQKHLPVDIPPQPPSPPKRKAPPGATDCHFHIFGPRDRYPLSPDRMYEPAAAPIEAYRQMAGVLGIERTVIVNGSPYGTDNSVIMDSIEQFGLDRSRGVAVVGEGITDAEFREMNRRGIRGIRFNAITARTPLSLLNELAERIKPMGWHIQLWIKGERLAQVVDMVKALPVPVVIDHMGQVPTSLGMDHPHFRMLLDLLATGRVWIKMVGYRVSGGPPFDDLRAPAAALINAAPDRCIWGTDWPHPFLEGKAMLDDGKLLDLLYSWADEEQVHRILVENPARLYGF